jgi:hypothetical protein
LRFLCLFVANYLAWPVSDFRLAATPISAVAKNATVQSVMVQNVATRISMVVDPNVAPSAVVVQLVAVPWAILSVPNAVPTLALTLVLIGAAVQLAVAP